MFVPEVAPPHKPAIAVVSEDDEHVVVEANSTLADVVVVNPDVVDEEIAVGASCPPMKSEQKNIIDTVSTGTTADCK